MGGLSWSTLNQHCFSQKIPHFASLLKTLVVCVLVGVLEALANFFNTATLGRWGPIISMATKSRCLYQEKHGNSSEARETRKEWQRRKERSKEPGAWQGGKNTNKLRGAG